VPETSNLNAVLVTELSVEIDKAESQYTVVADFIFLHFLKYMVM
jgi:uncharacterized surface protein with fasciclin (FAS1) repeats